MREMCEDEEKSNEDIIDALKTSLIEQPIPDVDFVGCIWQGLMSVIDWNTRADQIEGVVLREVEKYASILEPFCTSAGTQVALINAVQLNCYEETRIIKTFPQILKILYNKDCITAQAIIYWHQKGSKAQGKQHFLKNTESLVKFLEAQEESDEEEE